MKESDQPGWFDSHTSGGEPTLPAGFKYQSGVITVVEEETLLAHIKTLSFKEFEFHGFLGKRRVVSFGWRYDFSDRRLQKADDIPAFLRPLRERAAAFAGLGPEDFQHVLVTEYAPGAAIGWHKDKAVFDQVVGISLASASRFRFRRKVGNKWERAALTIEPRSAYLLAGPARTEWEHSIPPVERLRYSITLRNFVNTEDTASETA
jgi:alkylated DNA repair dioxygenase AlkB